MSVAKLPEMSSPESTCVLAPGFRCRFELGVTKMLAAVTPVIGLAK